MGMGLKWRILFGSLVVFLFVEAIAGSSTHVDAAWVYLQEYSYYASTPLNQIQANLQQTKFDEQRGWKGEAELPPVAKSPRRHRIVLLGDSNIHGVNILPTQTVQSYLQNLMGKDYEVVDLAVNGYALDQIVLTELEIVPQYRPELLVLAFSQGTLDRSCPSFSYGMKKPNFIYEGKDIKVMGAPVPTPQQTFAEHQTPIAKTRDGLVYFALKSKALRLAMGQWFASDYELCTGKLPSDLLAYASEHSPLGSSLVVAQLDGSAKYYSDSLFVPAQIEKYTKQLKVSAEVQTDGHPAAGLNQIYAHAIYDYIKAKVYWKVQDNTAKSEDR